MSSLKGCISSLGAILVMTIAALPGISEAQSFAGELIMVPASKLPQQAHQPGQAMHLYLADPGTLYLYVEQEDGRRIAIFDVSDPQRIKFKRFVALDTRAPFDFVQPAGESLEMIRYRDGRGTAILDLSNAKNPVLKPLGAGVTKCAIVPVGNKQGRANEPVIPQDYQIIEPSTSRPVATVKAVVQQQTNEATGTTYLLGQDGLTVIRNVKIERRLEAMSPDLTDKYDRY
jgi:hypothetical protein